MKKLVTVTALCLGVTSTASAADQSRRAGIIQPQNGRVSCHIEVLHSEELAGAPIFQNLVKATLLVNAPGTPPFETSVVKLIPWQMPPPRQGQRLIVPCDPASLSSGLSANLSALIFP
ncbi:hypothetical protein [Bradyrhizobium sp.]|uniref:hypothetical protein n=1 Tax=Bradyrhizobium sp. TaxID=376 RepID=UPI003C63DA05